MGMSTAVGFGACVAILLASCGEAKTSMTVRAVVRPERSVCEDSSGTNLEGTRFTITDAAGGTIAEGTLGPATSMASLG